MKTTKVEIDLSPEKMGKLFAHMPSDDQVEFLAAAWRHMGTYKGGTLEEQKAAPRDQQLCYIGQKAHENMDAKEMTETLSDVVRAAIRSGGWAREVVTTLKNENEKDEDEVNLIMASNDEWVDETSYVPKNERTLERKPPKEKPEERTEGDDLMDFFMGKK